MTAPVTDGRQLLIDELGDVELVDTLLMKLWAAGYKLVSDEALTAAYKRGWMTGRRSPYVGRRLTEK